MKIKLSEVHVVRLKNDTCVSKAMVVINYIYKASNLDASDPNSLRIANARMAFLKLIAVRERKILNKIEDFNHCNAILVQSEILN